MPFLSLPESRPGALGSSTSGAKHCSSHPSQELLRITVSHLKGLSGPPPPKLLWKPQDPVMVQGLREMA